MSKEKQIEEMAHHLCLWWDGKICTFTKHDCNHDCSAFLDSARLYGAGYRKQSEGEWVAKSPMVRTPFAKNHYCSVCNYEPIEVLGFCPNCGAKMKGGAE